MLYSIIICCTAKLYVIQRNYMLYSVIMCMCNTPPGGLSAVPAAGGLPPCKREGDGVGDGAREIEGVAVASQRTRRETHTHSDGYMDRWKDRRQHSSRRHAAKQPPLWSCARLPERRCLRTKRYITYITQTNTIYCICTLHIHIRYITPTAAVHSYGLRSGAAASTPPIIYRSVDRQ